MINTKDEVVNWFKELKSYNRIDTMCTLLNMCLPFELRFLGTCLEELGRRDAQELRGIELRVNNPQEFISDIASCQGGEPTDRKHRRKMALFLALIRACNHTCVNELFRTLEGWGTRDFTRLFDEDVLQELLLVYTMATNHPVFSFEQRMKCGDIFNKLKTCELKPPAAGSPQQQQHHHHSDSANSTPPPTQVPPPPTAMQPQMPPMQHPQVPPQPQQGGGGAGGPIPIPGFPQPALAQMIPADGSMPAHVTVEGLQQMQMHIPQDFTMPPPSTVPHWTLRNTVFHQTSFPPPSSSSPHLSNPSSPIQSRTASPTRILPTSSVQHRISRNQQPTPVVVDHRVTVVDRDSQQQQQQQQQQQPLKSLDESMLLNVDQTTALTQLQQLRNGYRPSHNTLPRQSNKQSYVNQIQYHHQQQQQQQQQQQSGFHGTSVGLGSLTHTLNNISLIDLTQKSSSDSGSSTGDISPPETPGLSTVPPPVPSNVERGGGGGGGLIRSRSSNLGRINGRPDKQQQQQQQQLGSSVIYTQQTQQQQAQQQQTQQFVGGSNEIMVTSATQNLINSNNNTNTMNTSNGSNSSVVSGAVLIGPPTPTAGGANLVLSSQPQFTPAPYPPYHTAAHLASARPTLIAAHAAPGSAFRPPTAAYPPMQHNGEILYPYAGGPTIAFLTTATAPIAPGAPPPQNLQTMRSAAQTAQPPPPQQQPQPQPPQLIQQQQQQQPPPQQKVVVPPPHPPAASTPTGSLYSPLSCFNCGSQKHTGLDCQESSMEDVTRNSIYKLDYNASLIASQQLAAAAAAAALSAAGGGVGPTQPPIAPASSSPSSLVVVPSSAVVSSALSASVSVSRMSLVDTAKGGDSAAGDPSPSPVHHSTASSAATTTTTLPLTLSQQSLVDASTSVSTQTINNQTDSSSSSTISK